MMLSDGSSDSAVATLSLVIASRLAMRIDRRGECIDQWSSKKRLVLPIITALDKVERDPQRVGKTNRAPIKLEPPHGGLFRNRDGDVDLHRFCYFAAPFTVRISIHDFASNTLYRLWIFILHPLPRRTALRGRWRSEHPSDRAWPASGHQTASHPRQNHDHRFLRELVRPVQTNHAASRAVSQV